MKINLASGHYLLYGHHAVQAALQNTRRVKRCLYLTAAAQAKLARKPTCRMVSVEAEALKAALGPAAVHQGMALEVQPLPQPDLEAVLQSEKPLLMLDQVSDPHNIGAILRSCAAFDAGGVLMQDKHAPSETATIAKTAAGALEIVPMVKVTNLARSLAEAAQSGYWSVGLDGGAKQSLHQLTLAEKTVLVMGAEGKGLRPLVAKHCDMLAKLPIHPQMESLNVSVAAGIGLYQISLR